MRLLFAIIFLLIDRADQLSWRRIGGAGNAADEARLVARDALESHEFGGEMVAVDGFFRSGTDGAWQVAVAAARIADRLRSDALHLQQQSEKIERGIR